MQCEFQLSTIEPKARWDSNEELDQKLTCRLKSRIVSICTEYVVQE